MPFHAGLFGKIKSTFTEDEEERKRRERFQASVSRLFGEKKEQVGKLLTDPIPFIKSTRESFDTREKDAPLISLGGVGNLLKDLIETEDIREQRKEARNILKNKLGRKIVSTDLYLGPTGPEQRKEFEEKLTDQEKDVLNRIAEENTLNFGLGIAGISTRISGSTKGIAKKLGLNPNELIDKVRSSGDPLFKSIRRKLKLTPKQAEIPGLRPSKLTSPASIEALEDALRSNFTNVFAKSQGILTNKELVEQASKLGITKELLLDLPSGTLLNAKQFTAARQLIAAEGENVIKLKALAVTREPNAMRAYTQASIEHSRLLATQKAIAKGGGQLTQSNRIVIDAISNEQKQLNRILEQASEDTIEVISKKIEQLDLNDPKAVRELIGQLTEVSFLNKLVEFSVAVKLYNPTTWVVNVTSNLIRGTAEIPFKAVAGAVDIFLGPFYGGSRQRFLGEAGADVFGKLQGTKAGIVNAWKALADESASTFGKVSKLEEVSPRGIAIKGAKGKVIRTSFRILGAGDEYFKTVNNSAALHSLAFRKASKEGLKGDAKAKRIVDLLTSPTEDMIIEAEKQTLKTVFQEPLGEIGKSLNRIRNKHPALKFIVPFFRTPFNLLKQGVEFSPLGVQPLVKGLKGGRGEAADAIARYSIGSLVTLGLTMYALDGNITGPGPSSRAARDALFRQGWQPFSIKINGKYYSYQRIDPFAQLFQIAAAIGESFKEGSPEAPADKIQLAASQVAKGMLNKSYVRGLNDTFNALFDPTRSGANWIERFVTGQIPNISGAVARAVDPNIRETEGIPQAIQAQIPFLSKQLLPKRGALGQKIERTGSTLERLVSPVRVSEERPTLVGTELQKLDITVGFVGSTMTINNKKQTLGPKSKNLLQNITGKVIDFRLTRLFENPSYNNLSKQKKEKAVESTIRKARAEGKDLFIKKKKEEQR